MDQHESLFHEMVEYSKTPAFKTLTHEEITIMLYKDVVYPYLEKIMVDLGKLAYNFSPYPKDGH